MRGLADAALRRRGGGAARRRGVSGHLGAPWPSRKVVFLVALPSSRGSGVRRRPPAEAPDLGKMRHLLKASLGPRLRASASSMRRQDRRKVEKTGRHVTSRPWTWPRGRFRPSRGRD